MLDLDRPATLLWDGDLLHFSGRVSSDDSDVAALVVAGHGHARAWINLRLVPPDVRPWIWLRLRCAAERRPCTVLMAADLAALPTVDDPAELGC